MKSKILSLIIISFLSLLVVSGQNTSRKNIPVGSWKFEAPYAPEGYTSGTIIVRLTEQRYAITMSFTGNDNRFTGDKVKFENDSLFFSLYIEGQDVEMSLKLKSGTMMSGKAVYSEGEIPLTLLKSTVEVKAEIK